LRVAPRIYGHLIARGKSKSGDRGILIYGSGVAGSMLVRELRQNPRLNYTVLGFLDDDHSRRDAMLMGVPVLGTGRDAKEIVERFSGSPCKVQEIVIAVPSANASQMEGIIANCRAAGVHFKTIPSHGELLSGRIRNGGTHTLSPDDLLGRDTVQLNEDNIRAQIAGRTLLVTGAAGSIGSELCRQIARFEPRKLIAFDQAESELFKLDLNLRESFPNLDLQIEIGDVRELDRLEELLSREPVDAVLHAAAYKHVPLMESHVLEAVKNNVLGTWNVLTATRRSRATNYLLISTDKAVRPSSIMGLTKRIAELLTSAVAAEQINNRRRFVSVRFGNVLGSNGSVVPIFQAQIAAGGPVKVTHPDVQRYFMTIREAVQLILQASTMGKGSEVFVLDMGEPVVIADLARNMIRLSGFVPDEEIKIKYTGLRPGEKLFEELITDGENILATYHQKIKIFQGAALGVSEIETWIERVKIDVEKCDAPALVALMKELVPEYQPLSEDQTVPVRVRAMAVGRA
jgi:FlaA1/EpsC-like NDP-sugar epimerase